MKKARRVRHEAWGLLTEDEAHLFWERICLPHENGTLIHLVEASEVTALKRENARLKRVAKALKEVLDCHGGDFSCTGADIAADAYDALAALSRGGRKGRGK